MPWTQWSSSFTKVQEIGLWRDFDSLMEEVRVIKAELIITELP